MNESYNRVLAMMSRSNCIVCCTPVPDWEPQMCCDGRECACMGLPVEPPICSQACWDIGGWYEFIPNENIMYPGGRVGGYYVGWHDLKHMWE